ncbi:hypothetical protein [Solibacillus sp. CAU 1738]|uniref:hypothetical protein n=1 Tax=Solibacillus sp. CAU 1738 TaxID=3140363 RepID=UPI00325FF2F6
MISVERKLFFMELIDVFLAEEYNPKLTKKNIVVYHYAKVSGGNLFKEITYQINLEKDESELMDGMNKGNRNKLRRAKKEPYVVIIKDNPTDEDLKEFQQFYNKFVKIKKTNKINFIQMRRLKLLRNKGVLIFTKLQNTNGEALCYQIRLIDQDLVLSLYGCTAVWIKNRPDLKQQIRYANRFLLWENIMHFKNRGFKTYDYGGITEVNEINKFKEDFGFIEVETYHGLETESVIGKILIKLHWKKLIYLF